MAIEGQFPKVDGDILYASEANRLAKCGTYWFLGSTASFNSGTAAQTLGSFVFAAGSLSNPTHIVVDTYIAGAESNLIVFLSGVSASTSVTIGGPGALSQFGARTDIITGSPFTGVIKGTGVGTGFGTQNTSISTMMNGLSNLNTSAATVLFLNSNVAANGTYVIYAIKAKTF